MFCKNVQYLLKYTNRDCVFRMIGQKKNVAKNVRAHSRQEQENH